MFIGNLNAKRDWGHAEDYVEMQWLMLQQKKPQDYVIASGKYYSVKDFINKASKYLNINLTWKGVGEGEKGFDDNGKCIIEVDKRYYRPAEVDELLGDAQKARLDLGWYPKNTIDDLIKKMIDNDLKIAKKESLIKSSGL